MKEVTVENTKVGDRLIYTVVSPRPTEQKEYELEVTGFGDLDGVPTIITRVLATDRKYQTMEFIKFKNLRH